MYRRYGRDRAGIAATVIHYRPRMAVREVGKALGLSEDVDRALAADGWGAAGELWPDDGCARPASIPAAGRPPAVALARRAARLPAPPVAARRRLRADARAGSTRRCRSATAAMADRTFIEWDKDDIDALGLMKVDVLALGMLTCIHKASTLRLIADGRRPTIDDLAQVPREDPAVYDMLRRATAVGVFQVESRAQMNMLPRLRPRKFYDLVIEVAIVRPGPIQGDMVHPYLRRRRGWRR